jgi:hypothetical protein
MITKRLRAAMMDSMKIVASVWHARRNCPVCEQGNSLAFRSCPRCALVIVLCEEEGSVFPNPRALDAPAQGLGSETACPSCGEVKIGDFPPTTAQQLQELGLGLADYE